jgi:hypothetical protein
MGKIVLTYDQPSRTNRVRKSRAHCIYIINLAPTSCGAAGKPSSGSPKDPDEIVRMLRYKCRISEGREWIPSVCCKP